MRTTLITGATDGIGLALARRLEAAGDRLVLVGRRTAADVGDPLLAPERYCRADLSAPDAAETVHAFVRAQGIERLDRLVHNAGVGFVAPGGADEPARLRSTLRVNVEAPMRLTHALLPLVRAARGRIAFVSSVLADLPMGALATYCGSKAAVDGLARSLFVELRGEVRVQAIHPGATRTGMAAKAGLPADAAARFAPVEDVARTIERQLEGRRRSPTVGLGNRVGRVVGRRGAWLLDPFLRWRAR